MPSAPMKHLDLKERIPFLKGRPHRELPIDKDDVLNLRIALGLHRDVSELWQDPHIFPAV